MKQYIKPEITFVDIEGSTFFAASNPDDMGFTVTGEGGTRGGITPTTPEETRGGLDFSKKNDGSFDFNEEW